MLKSFIRSTPFQAFVGALLAAYMSLVKHTTRWEVRGRDVIEPIWSGGEGVIACVWHARVLMTIADWPTTAQPVNVLISRSPDGEFVARAARHHNADVIRGSARNPKKSGQKGGVPAFRAMVEHIGRGGCVCITPDGPRGPRMRASMGAVRLAKTTAAPMVALAWSTRRRIVFKSWDRFVLPFPFGRGVIVWKGPIFAPSDGGDAEIEAARVALEEALIAANQEADAAAGVEVIQPAAAPTPAGEAA